MNNLTLPNLLSASRLPAAALIAWTIMDGRFHAAGAVFVLAVATDLADGHLARTRYEPTAIGGLLDHASDAVFVTAALGGFAYLGLLPTVLPVLVAAAFIQYTLDSNALAGQPLRASRLGRYNGILYFVLAGLLIAAQVLIPTKINPGLAQGAGWLLVASTLISMLDRLLALIRAHRA